MASRKEQKERLKAERLKRQSEEQAKQRRQRLVQYGSAAALLAVCVVAVLIIVSQSGGGSGGDPNLEGVSLVQKQLQGVPQHDTVLGDPKAKVAVVEYGDLQCPVCKAFAFQIAPSLISNVVRKGTAAYEFRQWPIIGPESSDAAKAALAAGEQGRYWNFVELFYQNQGTENSGYVTDDFLTAVAKGAGVPNIGKWNQDRQSSKWDPILARDDSEARGFGFTGTPSILVEGPGGRKTFAVIPTLSQIEGAIKSVK